MAVGAAVDLLAKIVGRTRVHRERAAAAQLARACGPLPLAIRIAAAQLCDEPGRPIANYLSALRHDRLVALRMTGTATSRCNGSSDRPTNPPGWRRVTEEVRRQLADVARGRRNRDLGSIPDSSLSGHAPTVSSLDLNGRYGASASSLVRSMPATDPPLTLWWLISQVSHDTSGAGGLRCGCSE